jgi:hypothetical protein
LSYKAEISAGWQGWIPESDKDERLALGAEAVNPAAHHHPLPAVSRSLAYLDPAQTYYSHPLYPCKNVELSTLRAYGKESALVKIDIWCFDIAVLLMRLFFLIKSIALH